MKPITLNRNSWHYKVATCVGGYRELMATSNFCSYSWHVLLGSFLFVALVACGILLVGFQGFDLAYLAAVLITGPFQIANEEGEILVGFIFSCLTLIVLLGYVCYKLEEYVDEQRRINSCVNKLVKQPGFIKLAYRSFKDKVCILIDFEDR